MPGRGLPNPIVLLLGFMVLSFGAAGLGLLWAWPAFGGWYRSVHRPPGSAAAWAFAACWSALALLKAVAAWRVWRSARRPPRHRALQLWSWMLVIGVAWCGCLFALRQLEGAILLVVLLLLLCSLALRDFAKVDRPAAFLLAPSLLWVCYATWLTIGIAWLNPTLHPA